MKSSAEVIEKLNMSVLIIEDDLIYGTQIKNWLGKKAEKVQLAENAERGSFFVSSLKPDVIFLDNMLPKLNGKEVIGLYKELSPASKVILMSSASNLEDIAEGIEKGADHFFNKRDTDKGEIQDILNVVVQSKKEKERVWRLWNIFNDKRNLKIHRSIAVVEDDEIFSFQLNWILSQSAKNHSVYTFSHAERFYDYCINTPPEFIFLDYYLPDANGEEVLKFLKVKVPEATVVVISSQEDPNVAIKLNDIGIENYIIKNQDWKLRLKKVISNLNI